jgi:hypothetical protein
MIEQKLIDLTDVLLSLTKNHEDAGFTTFGDGFPETESQYNVMTSFDNPDHKPLWKDVVEEYEILVAENEKLKYAFQRANEYPSVEEQLDLIFHGGIEQWQQQIQAIKDKYPKP